jgi:hypothetical protein
MRTTWFAVILVTLAVMSGACATPPKADIDAAGTAVDRAVAAKADLYAPASLKAAQDARSSLDAELKVQEGHLPMMRSYGEAVKLAQATKAAGERAEQDATGKQQIARAEASTLVVDAKASIEDAEAALDKASKGKRVPADIEVMKSNLLAAKSTIGEAETALATQGYAYAMAKAEAAKETAAAIVSSLEHAHEVQQPAGNRRR